MVVSEVAVDDEGDLDGGDLPLAEILGFTAAAAGDAGAVLGHGCDEEQKQRSERRDGPIRNTREF